MSTLSSASTYDQILAALADAASWEEDQSVTKAQAFLTAGRLLGLKRPVESRHGTQGMRWSESALKDDMDRARAFVAAHSTPTATPRNRTLHPDFSGSFRN